MLQARPLYDSDPDAAFFVEPAGWERLLAAVRHRFNVALVAPRGGGKTSALRQLQRALRAQGIPVVFVDATGVDEVSQLVDAIEAELAGSSGTLREAATDAAAPADPVMGGPPGATSLRIVQHLRALSEQAAAVVLVDCSYGARAANTLFGRLRDELWQLEHRWVVAVEDDERSILLAPPADAFFDQVVSLDLSQAQMVEVLRKRDTVLSEGILQRIAEQTSTPRAALHAAREALLDPHGDDPLAATLWRQQRAADLGRPHSMAMHELESLGGASASDEQFLRRFGWTRARASQVLGALAEAGLVVATDEQRPGGGRPRKVFRPAEPRPGAAAPSSATELPIPKT